MKKIIGTDDSINICDCCGKTGLKSTIIVEVDGEIRHYGSVCATRHTGKDSKTIKREIDAAYAANLDAAMNEYRASPEYQGYESALSAARALKIEPGIPFRNATRHAYESANAKSVEIAKKYNVRLLA